MRFLDSALAPLKCNATICDSAVSCRIFDYSKYCYIQPDLTGVPLSLKKKLHMDGLFR